MNFFINKIYYIFQAVNNYLKEAGEKGQTAIEYVLLLAVIAPLIFNLMGYFKDFMVGDAGKCTSNSKSLICMVELSLSKDQFKIFTLRR